MESLACQAFDFPQKQLVSLFLALKRTLLDFPISKAKRGSPRENFDFPCSHSRKREALDAFCFDADGDEKDEIVWSWRSGLISPCKFGKSRAESLLLCSPRPNWISAENHPGFSLPHRWRRIHRSARPLRTRTVFGPSQPRRRKVQGIMQRFFHSQERAFGTCSISSRFR